MLKFFRKIRQKLLQENRFSKYLIYASGEVLLVMIGILLALQVSNWNENQRRQNTEKEYLQALKEEFTFNKKELERVMKSNKMHADNALLLSNYMGMDKPNITEKEFADLVMKTFNAEVQYRPSEGVLEEIISSGKLGIFTNAALKFALSSLGGTLNKVRFQEQEHGSIRLQVLTVLIKEGNFRKSVTDALGEVYGIQPTNFDRGNLPLLNSEEFDGLLVVFILTSRYLNQNYYGKLDEEIDKMLMIIEEDLK